VILTRKLARLADERRKLLLAFYANAIPLELLKVGQHRISREEQAARSELDVSEADLEGWQDVLSMAIRLAGNCHAAYLKARPSVRRRFNEGRPRSRLREGPEDRPGGVLRGVRASLLSPEFAAAESGREGTLLHKPTCQ